MTLERPMFPPTDKTRRHFLSVAAAAIPAAVSTAAMAARPSLASPHDDSALLALEEQYFEQKELADSYTDEIIRLSAIWQAESERLYQEALREEVRAGKYLTPQERWDLVTKIPECVEHDRLCKLQGVHLAKMEALVKRIWATSALTPEGRRAKVLVALSLLPSDWQQVDDNTDYGIRETRQLLVEFVGGEPGEQMRDQFA
jgi:hypothetical protein